MTQGEQEYLDIVRRLVKSNQGRLDGERPLLDRQRDFFGVSHEAAAKIEQRVLVAYQLFLRRSTQAPSSSPSLPSVPTPTNGKRVDQDGRSADPNLAATAFGPDRLDSESIDPEDPAALAETQLAPPSYGSPEYGSSEHPVHVSSNPFNDDNDDFAEVYNDQADQFTPTYRPSNPPPSEGLVPTQLQSPALLNTTPQPVATALAEFADLDRALQQKQWKLADQLTLTLMLKISGAEAQGWLNPENISHLPCASLHAIDRLWRRHSSNKFGFSAQLQVFAKLARSLPSLQANPRSKANQQPLFNQTFSQSADWEYQKMLRFCKEVGWWQVGEFHKYYNQLDFHKYNAQPALALSKNDIPKGHLPALWYWTIPWWRALQLGGIGPNRGGCCVDSQTLTIFMTQLEKCEITPNSEPGSDRAIGAKKG